MVLIVFLFFAYLISPVPWSYVRIFQDCELASFRYLGTYWCLLIFKFLFIIDMLIMSNINWSPHFSWDKSHQIFCTQTLWNVIILWDWPHFTPDLYILTNFPSLLSVVLDMDHKYLPTLARKQCDEYLVFKYFKYLANWYQWLYSLFNT